MKAEKYIPTSSAVAAKSEWTINHLNDDCLGVIFNKLPYRDRVGIESVCKRWREVSRAKLCMYKMHLIIGEGTIPSLRGSTLEKTKHMLKRILLRRGCYIDEISFRDHIYGDYYNFKPGTIKRIVKCCPKLKHLTIGYNELNDEDWFACNNLETLSIGGYDIDGLRELFHRNKRLRRLELIDTDCGANIFDHLDAGQLEILHILDQNYELTARLVDKLAESLVELNYGSYFQITLPRVRSTLQHIRKLKNLRTLILNFQKVDRPKWTNTQFIVDIVDNCQKLERLVLILRKYQMPYEELDRVFREAPNLKLFVLSSCKKCNYQEDNVKRCNEHPQSGVRNINTVASKSNGAVIITTDTAVIMRRTGRFPSPQVESTYEKRVPQRRTYEEQMWIEHLSNNIGII